MAAGASLSLKSSSSIVVVAVVVLIRGGVDVVVVNTTVFVVVREQRAHKHWPNSPCFIPVNEGLVMVMYSEKNRSPLSSGNCSAFGNGSEQPTVLAISLTYHNSEWLKYGTTSSQPTGTFLRCCWIMSSDTLFSFRDAKDRLCLMARLCLAVPARLR